MSDGQSKILILYFDLIGPREHLCGSARGCTVVFVFLEGGREKDVFLVRNNVSVELL